MSSAITITFPDINAAHAMVEHHRREGEERERRAIARWLRWRAGVAIVEHESVSRAMHLLASDIEENRHEVDWRAALEHAGVDKDDA